MNESVDVDMYTLRLEKYNFTIYFSKDYTSWDTKKE